MGLFSWAKCIGQRAAPMKMGMKKPGLSRVFFRLSDREDYFEAASEAAEAAFLAL